MHENPKAPPPSELSLKYMAWDIKEISKSLKELVDLMRGNVNAPPRKENQRQDELF